jgi:CBS domain-containing protein
MKISEIMSPDPLCCIPGDNAQHVAQIMRDSNVGSVPVVLDQKSRKLVGMITDRDLCCCVIAAGLDPQTTKVEKVLSLNLVTCRDGESVEECERAMQDRQVRRIPIVDGEGRVIGIVSQADLALKDKPENVSTTVKEISKTMGPSVAA